MSDERFKIGIATHSFGFNYGGSLQCFALLKILNSNGYAAEYIDFRPPNDATKFKRFLAKHYSWWRFFSPKIAAYETRLRVFDNFRKKYCPKSPRFDSYSQVVQYVSQNNYDACIVGSDQVWNPSYSGMHRLYHLRFVPKHKRIAYAASFGLASLDNAYSWYFKASLGEFATLSVREKTGADIIENLGLKRPFVALDPALLATAQQWRAWSAVDDYSQKESPYVLCYPLKSDDEINACVALAKKTRDLLGVELKIVASDHNGAAFKKRFPDATIVENADPFEFVRLFDNAKFVVTNSFHGCVFSILFHRPFFSLLDVQEKGAKSTNSRLVDLFTQLGLTDRFVQPGDELDVASIPNYENVDAKLETLRQSSLDYLFSALKRTKETKEPNLCDYRSCCACGACAAKCPRNAIEMKLDHYGFYFPSVDIDRCVGCGLCEKACPILNPPTRGAKEPKVYATWNNDLETRRACSSGGMVPIYTNYVVERGGVAFGVAYDENLTPRFEKVDTKEGLRALFGSKYAEARVDVIFREVLEALNAKRPVVFTGTPCQVAGLRSYLGKDYPELTTIDICCHGVPSSKLYRARIDSLEKKYGEKIVYVGFRGKKRGWNRGLCAGNVYVTFASGRESDFQREDLVYTQAFTKNLSLRLSCGRCPYATLPRVGDITLADFWGIGYAKPFDYPKRDGISLLLINTPKGQELVDAYRERAEFVERSLAEAKTGNKTLVRPSRLHERRGLFVFDSMRYDFDRLESKWKTVIFSDVPKWKKIAVKIKKFIFRVAKLH